MAEHRAMTLPLAWSGWDSNTQYNTNTQYNLKNLNRKFIVPMYYLIAITKVARLAQGSTPSMSA